MSGGALDSSVTLNELFVVVCAKRVPLAPELAGYLILEIAEHADPHGGDVDPKSVFLSEEGTVAVVKPKYEAASGDAEESVRAALGLLLEASGSQTPALTAASKRRKGGGLSGLAAEIEAALIPVNRAAGRRALARLAREVKRVTLGVGRHTLPSSASVRAILREPAPAGRSSALSPEITEADVDALISRFGFSGDTDQQHARAFKAVSGSEPTPRPAAPAVTVKPQLQDESGALPRFSMPAPLSQPRATLPSARRGERPVRPHWGSALIFGLVVIVLGGYGAWLLRSRKSARQTAHAGVVTAAVGSRETSMCMGTLLVTEVPQHAEVLLHEGRAPVDVQRMPVGARLEFVATADGYAPRRVVIAATAGWDTGPDGKPRFEAAVQLEPSHTRTPNADPWPPGEPGSAVGGEGPPGTLHVVATPRGADIWMLAGIGPEARIEHLPCDQDVDILLAGPTIYRMPLHVSAADFVPDDASRGTPPKVVTRTARVSAK